jgi:predicted Zn-dependent peptidase
MNHNIVPNNDIKIHTLDNNAILITERMENIYSLSIGIWIQEGSRDEDQNLIGISHFTEHMFFKGTRTKSPLDIAKIIDSLGGNIDAFTSKENMCFYGNFLEEHFPIAAELFSDLIINPAFDITETEKERNVIIEEIKSIEDSPSELLFDLFCQFFWDSHPLGQPISGTLESVSKITNDDIKIFFNNKFYPDNMLITVAGSLDHDEIFKISNEYFGKYKKNITQKPIRTTPKNNSFIKLINKKQLEQVHICLGTIGYPAASEKRYAYYLLNTILGGSMSSRLFQKIREQEGLVYSISSFINSFIDTGLTIIYLATSKENTKKALKLSSEEIIKLKNEYIDESELERAKQHLKGNLLLGLESSSNRMVNLAKQYTYLNKFISVNEVVEHLNSVTKEDIQELANELFQTKFLACAIIGDTESLNIEKEEIGWD